MSMVISLANSKGGVGKTTGVFNFGCGMRLLKNKKVLLIDLDHQSNLTSACGLSDRHKYPNTIYKALKKVIREESFDPRDYIVTLENGVDVIPSELDLDLINLELTAVFNREKVLKTFIDSIQGYDYIIIDCPPNGSLLIYNALSCSNKVFIPTTPDRFGVEALPNIFTHINRVKKNINTDLYIGGVFFSLVKPNTLLAKEAIEQVRNIFGQDVYIFNSVIPLAEDAKKSVAEGKSVFEFKKNSRATSAYYDLLEEVLNLG